MVSNEDLLSVPIWIDDIKRSGSFKMTRFCYFIAEVDVPIDDWELTLKTIDIPVIVYGLTFAICRPSGSKSIFEKVEDVEQLFHILEDKNLFSIETQDLWLPNEILAAEPSPKRGDVYRISQKLFTSALRFRTDRITDSEFKLELKKLKEKIKRSDHETKVFRDWSIKQVEEAKKLYHQESSKGSFMVFR